MDIIFDEASLDHGGKTQRLAEAIADARLPVKQAKAG
jgi:hypothetical protein